MYRKVLCIDDDPIALLLSKLVLTKANFASEIVPLHNGEEASNYLALNETKNNYDSNQNLIVFLDLNMPIMDGWEFLEKFQSQYYVNYPNIKIILLTSSVDPSDKERANQFPTVLEFISKPLSKEVLSRLVENYNL